MCFSFLFLLLHCSPALPSSRPKAGSGDGKPKPISFPDPAEASVDIDGIRYASMATLMDLKLASGMTNPGRLKDLADVQELIRVRNLAPEFAQQLNPFVREKFTELCSAIQGESAPES